MPMQTSKPKWLILITLYLAVFLNSFGYFITIPVLVDLIANPHASILSPEIRSTLGDYIFSIVLGAGSLSHIICAPLFGRWSDQIGRKKVLMICTIFMLAGFLLPAISLLLSSLSLFLLGNILNGIASINQPLAQAAITDISPNVKNKAMRFSVDTVVICFAMVTGPIAGNVLSNPHWVAWFSNTTPFFAAAILAGLALILIMTVLPETKPQTSTHLSLNKHNTFQAFLDAFKLSPSLSRCLLVFLLAQTAWAQFYQYFFMYLKLNFNFSDNSLAIYNALLGVYLIFGLLIIYPILISFVSFRRSVSLSLFLATLGALLIGFVHTRLSMWLGAIPLSIGIGLYFPSLLTLFSNQTDQNNQGWILSFSMSLIGVGWLITGFTAIALSQITADLPMQTLSICLITAWLLMLYENRASSKQLKA